nr:beta-1,4-glucuronyltransferase 1 isoform X1 [Ciona intestinalis]XP_026689658.1 beta-1,4-glucuronyltransferase 1 isoform X1 [Ciona intestinalis]|eukprot:XP_002132013.1 beta-1,4-glucuronyltransferase 1 isoform X1 [Ciona intestinalis]
MIITCFDIKSGYKYSVLVLVALGVQTVILSYYNYYEVKTNKIRDTLQQHIQASSLIRGEYRVVYNFKSHLNTSEKLLQNDVTLVTQCSVNNLYHLIETLQLWKGPISVALFVPGSSIIHAELAIKFIKQCFPLRKVQFHLVYPEHHTPTFDGNNLEIWVGLLFANDRLRCKDLFETLSSIEGENYATWGIPYPQNTLRNVAKLAVQTEYLIVLDIDVMPSYGLRENFLEKVLRNRGRNKTAETKIAYIPPAFELKINEQMPENKALLLTAWKSNQIRPFHYETCPSCHKPARYDEWKAISTNLNLGIAYEAEWQPSWEPFYIAHTSHTPDYDERFKQYGYDRISQNCELRLCGFTFVVMANSFVVHKGFKERGKFHHEKEVENKRNFNLFQNVFIPEMTKKYSSSGVDCLDSGRRKGKAKITFRQHFNKNTKEKLLRNGDQVEL